VGLKDNLAGEVKETFSKAWVAQKTNSVPAPEDLRLNANHAKNLEKATVLYADLDGSTDMVDRYNWEFSAEIYKTFLRCASQIIRSEGGSITAYDGDRVMAIFTGSNKKHRRCTLCHEDQFCRPGDYPAGHQRPIQNRFQVGPRGRNRHKPVANGPDWDSWG